MEEVLLHNSFIILIKKSEIFRSRSDVGERGCESGDLRIDLTDVALVSDDSQRSLL